LQIRNQSAPPSIFIIIQSAGHFKAILTNLGHFHQSAGLKLLIFCPHLAAPLKNIIFAG